MCFCDTSTLAKYYVPEKESSSVRLHLDQENQVMVSELARVELMGVFHRRLRERKWNRDEFMAVVQQFSHDDIEGHWSWLPLDGTIVEQASKIFIALPDSVFLRSSDCLHLVTALYYRIKEIYTYDAHQIQAASVLGLKPISISV
ncbi:MAG: hypothetical protein A3F67_03370 [Verrucomicrobia bacterium RIFCSPHIGHO2_12_FULL_41_10]|nr:MAG: hypothetical protein A3F67_03370 [Verrucomicrobia bacterium RIFCSPHIGHO2_12_FULL_41_10]HLB34848.1 type II toxin-antitoxin system VapC family toxin [Chthoniobacterales bacterium]